MKTPDGWILITTKKMVVSRYRSPGHDGIVVMVTEASGESRAADAIFSSITVQSSEDFAFKEALTIARPFFVKSEDLCAYASGPYEGVVTFVQAKVNHTGFYALSQSLLRQSFAILDDDAIWPNPQR